MDINVDNFLEQIPNLLAVIASADYIAIDLEMSGVRVKDSLPRGAVSLEQVYSRVKAAASTFAALQLGVTAIRWTGGSYQLSSFSVPISPMFATTTKESFRLAEVLDRKLSFSYETLLFLQRHRFDFGEALGKGVPYLSRQELDEAADWLGGDKEKYEQIDPATLEESQRAFWDCLREEIREWLAGAPSQRESLRVFDPSGGSLRRSTTRLAWALLRQEFPHCRCWRDKGNWVMNIQLRNDKDREIESRRAENKKAAIEDQLGVSLVLEALFGGAKLSELLQTGTYTPSSTASPELLQNLGHDASKWPEDAHGQWEKLAQMIQASKAVLVGHNLIYDLCYLYSMFVGQLPDTLAEFRAAIKGLFPRLVDTRLLISPTVDPDVVELPLEETYTDLTVQAYPTTEAIAGWAYTVGRKSFQSKSGAAHDAGFDSYMTATVFLKLSCRKKRLQDLRQRGGVEESSSARGEGVFMSREETRMAEDNLSPMDRYLPAEDVRLPGFNHGFWAAVRNRLRMSTAGVLDLGTDGDEAAKYSAHESGLGGADAHKDNLAGG